jgi:hypothetical protein
MLFVLYAKYIGNLKKKKDYKYIKVQEDQK